MFVVLTVKENNHSKTRNITVPLNSNNKYKNTNTKDKAEVKKTSNINPRSITVPPHSGVPLFLQQSSLQVDGQTNFRTSHGLKNEYFKTISA